MKKIPVALQLFSVFKACEENPVETIKSIANMGYQGIEIVWTTWGLKPAELKKLCDDVGLNPISSHIPTQVWEAQGEKFADDLAEIGVKYSAIPWLPVEMRPGQVDYSKTVECMKKVSGWLAARGIVMLYHNHDFEFERVDNMYALDKLYQDFTPEELQAELDIYWIKFAGEDPAAYIRKYAGRLPVLHLKDMEDTPEKFFTEVGNGTQDLPGIFEAAEEAGVTWYVVEQDRSRIDPMESVRISRENLRRLGL